jgi:hypothetical protein
MSLLTDIFRTFFGKPKKQDNFGNGGDFFKPEMNVVHKKNEQEKELEVTNHQVCNEVQESIIPNSTKELTTPKPKKERVRSVIGQKTLSEIKDYLLTYGSIDVLTCEQKFKVKSLHNFIWHLRKEGLKIKTNKVGLHNEIGQKVEVTNYILITKK